MVHHDAIAQSSYYGNIDPAPLTLKADLQRLVPCLSCLTLPHLLHNLNYCLVVWCRVCASPLLISCEFTPMLFLQRAIGSEKCGNYAREGNCYNREHVWSSSWWGMQPPTGPPTRTYFIFGPLTHMSTGIAATSHFAMLRYQHKTKQDKIR